MTTDSAPSSKISTRRQNARRIAATDYERRRRKILDAAAQVFKEVGLSAASVDFIAQRAEMDRASIYYYFGGKKELFREMVGGATTENVEMAERISQSADTPEVKLRTLIRELFQSYERHYPYLYVFVQEDMTHLARDRSAWSKKIVALNRRFDVATSGILQDGLDSGLFRSTGDARLLAAGVVGMCNWSHRWFEPSGKRSALEIADAFADMILNGLVVR
jgi:AcrR family transcriptional regulator